MRAILHLLLLIPLASSQAERVDGAIDSVNQDLLSVSTRRGTIDFKLTVLTEMAWSNTWHSLEALPVEGRTAKILLDPDPERALQRGPKVLERARKEGVIAVHARCLVLTGDDRVDHVPTGDYPVWVGLVKKDKAGNATITVDKQSYKLEIKAKKDLGWFYTEAKSSDLKKGLKVVVVGSKQAGEWTAEQVWLPGVPRPAAGRSRRPAPTPP